jgi:hypothetical protein
MDHVVRLIKPMQKPLSLACAVAALSLCLNGCVSLNTTSTQITASIQAEGLINCIPRNSRDQNGQISFCEASAVALLGKHLLIGSDKPLVDRQSLVSVQLQELQPTPGSEKLFTAPYADTASKIEGMTLTPDGQYLIITTAFDRIDHRSAALDPYNILLAAPVSAPNTLQIVASSTRQGITSSLEIRRQIEAHLGLPYFKVEGLVALPGQRLIFGLRETGSSHSHFNYRFLLLQCHYSIDAQKQLVLELGFETLLDFNTAQVLPDAEGLGLSSIEYDPARQRLFFATSHENEGVMGAYFWQMSLNDLDSGKLPQLLRQADGSPLHLNHKSEGITRIDSNHLFIINDDDRDTGGNFNRLPHQAVYQVIQINEP